MTARELHCAHNHMLLLIKSAKERVASFLMEMAGRGSEANEVTLPMSRQDIADFLGLTIETVSRTISQLENAHAIALPSSRRVALRNRAMLSRLTASYRIIGLERARSNAMDKINIKSGDWVVVCDGRKAIILENIGDASTQTSIPGKFASTPSLAPVSRAPIVPARRIHP